MPTALAPLAAHPTLERVRNGRNIRLIGFGEMFRQPIVKGNFAVVAFNARNFPLPKPGGYEEGYIGPSTVTPILRVARALEAPVVFEVAHSEFGSEKKPYTGIITRNGMEQGVKLVVTHILAEYERLKMAGIPIGIHYDHGSSAEIMKACIEAGFTSVAMDGGDQKSWADLTGKAREWVEYCHPKGVGVEGEIETVGGQNPTEPEQAIKFAQETGVDVLVVTLKDNKHGSVPGTSVMEEERLAAVRQALPDMPVNLHGGSGFALHTLTRASMRGLFQKLNYATLVYEEMVKAVPGWLEILNMVAGKPKGTRPKEGRDQLALTDPLLRLMTPEVVAAAEAAAEKAAGAVMQAVGNVRTAQYYSV